MKASKTMKAAPDPGWTGPVLGYRWKLKADLRPLGGWATRNPFKRVGVFAGRCKVSTGIVISLYRRDTAKGEPGHYYARCFLRCERSNFDDLCIRVNGRSWSDLDRKLRARLGRLARNAGRAL